MRDNLDPMIMTEEQAREYFETARWPNGPVCPRCGGQNVVKLKTTSCRPGVYNCRPCYRHFTVTVGTVFEGSHIRLREWVIALHMMCSSKKGVSAHQIHRMLHITYRSAWFMCHRIRYAMRKGPLADKMRGIVEVDETHIGGKPRRPWPKGGPYLGTDRLKEAAKKKTTVVALVTRGGDARVFPVRHRTSWKLAKLVRENVDLKNSTVMTDEFPSYKRLDKMTNHVVIDHRRHYALPGGINTNTVESFWALLKRGVRGTFHHVSKKHIDRYCDEFAFRWNHRQIEDADRTRAAAKAIEGKRLMYRDSSNGGGACGSLAS